MSNNVKILEIDNPNIIVIANGCCISAPSPNASPNGIIANTVVKVVSRIGRNLLLPASIIASYRSIPRLRKILI